MLQTSQTEVLGQERGTNETTSRLSSKQQHGNGSHDEMTQH